MRKTLLLSGLCALGLLAAPAMAAGTATPKPQGSGATTNGAGTQSGASSSTAAKKTSATHSVHMAHARRGSGSSQDNMADQLNSQSLQAAQQGRPYSVSH